MKPEPDSAGPKPIRNIRISDRQWKLIQQHFSSKGLSISAGIRMVLREYLMKINS